MDTVRQSMCYFGALRARIARRLWAWSSAADATMDRPDSLQLRLAVASLSFRILPKLLHLICLRMLSTWLTSIFACPFGRLLTFSFNWRVARPLISLNPQTEAPLWRIKQLPIVPKANRRVIKFQSLARN